MGNLANSCMGMCMYIYLNSLIHNYISPLIRMLTLISLHSCYGMNLVASCWRIVL